LQGEPGSGVARRNDQVRDPAVLNARTRHTSAKKAVTGLEEIIYIGGYVEPGGTKAPRLDLVRKTAFEDLGEAVYMILSDTLQYLRRGNREIDLMTESAFAYYCNLHNQK